MYSSILTRWCGPGAILAGVLFAVEGYFGIAERALDCLVPLLFLLGLVGLRARCLGRTGWLGEAGFILGFVASAWGSLLVFRFVDITPLYQYFVSVGLPPWLSNWFAWLVLSLIMIGVAATVTKALRGYGALSLTIGVSGWLFFSTKSGGIIETHLGHVAFGALFCLSWVVLGYTLWRDTGYSNEHLGVLDLQRQTGVIRRFVYSFSQRRRGNLLGRFSWPSRFPNLLNISIVLLTSVVLLLTISGSLLYDRYESSLQHDSNTTATQPATSEVETAQTEEAVTFPEQEPATTKGTPSEAINAYPAEETSDLQVIVRVVDAPTWLVVQEDGEITLDQENQPGFLREFAANQWVGISTENAGATWIGVNGYDLGPLGASGEFAASTYTVGP